MFCWQNQNPINAPPHHPDLYPLTAYAGPVVMGSCFGLVMEVPLTHPPPIPCPAKLSVGIFQPGGTGEDFQPIPDKNQDISHFSDLNHGPVL